MRKPKEQVDEEGNEAQFFDDFESGDAGTGQGLLVQSAVFAGGALTHYRNGQLIDSRTHTYATGVFAYWCRCG